MKPAQVSRQLASATCAGAVAAGDTRLRKQLQLQRLRQRQRLLRLRVGWIRKKEQKSRKWISCA
jgi:hypothetical protein